MGFRGQKNKIMPTSEVKRLAKIIDKIAKENREDYSCSEIRSTTSTFGIQLEYRAYINRICPWLTALSINDLVNNVKNHINKNKNV